MAERLIVELRRKLPGLSKRCSSGSKGAAIRLACLECQGGHRAEVEQCAASPCPLFEFRLDGNWVKRPDRAPLTPEQLEVARIRGQALAKHRANGPQEAFSDPGQGSGATPALPAVPGAANCTGARAAEQPRASSADPHDPGEG